jgi:hypothetical protein
MKPKRPNIGFAPIVFSQRAIASRVATAMRDKRHLTAKSALPAFVSNAPRVKGRKYGVKGLSR